MTLYTIYIYIYMVGECVCVDILLETFFTRPTEMHLCACMCAHSPFVVSDKVFMCVCVCHSSYD